MAGAAPPPGIAYGPDAGLEAGYARCPAGMLLIRGHTPGRAPDWFGPAVGKAGGNRFDMPTRHPGDPGTCYLATALEGVIVERVLRGRRRRVIARSTLRRRHALADATVVNDLILIDLVQTLSTVHRLEITDVSAPPPYTGTQRLAQRWARAAHPVRVHGILYASRFAPGALCIALWDRAASALSWGRSRPFDEDMPALVAAMKRMGVGLV